MSEALTKLIDNYHRKCCSLVRRDKSFYTDMLQEIVTAAASEGLKILCHECNAEYGLEHTGRCSFKNWTRLWVILNISEELA